MRFIKFLIITYLLTIISCSPSLGASWYAKSGRKSSGISMYVTSIKVLDKDVTVNNPDPTENDPVKKFAEAKRFSISVPYSVKSIDISSLKIEAYGDYRKREPLQISLEIEGENVPLVAGEAVSITLRVKDNAGRYSEEEKFISVTREMPEAVELKLLKLKVHDANVEDIGAEKLVCNIPYSRGDVVTAGDVRATFKVGEEEKVLPVILKVDQVLLKVEEEVEVSFSVEEKQGIYKSFSGSVWCKRLEKTNDEDEPLTMEYLSVLGIDARSGLIKVANNVSQIVADDVVAMFKTFGRIDVTLQTEIVKFDSAGTAELIISIEGKKGEYSSWSKTVHAVKEGQENPEDPETPSEPEPEDPSEPEPPVLANPIDENGQQKFIVKINVKKEEIDPFDWYKEDTFFSASLFDKWILNMTSMTSDNVASYAFKEGEWSGTPLSCTGGDIGQGQMNHTWNLKYYKYKDQEERWAERGGYSSNIDETEKKKRERFVFFRFTGSASAGTRLDNSMFCVDTHTKFLFYYSDPSHISSFGVPSGWKDYDEADDGQHRYFDKPFYLTDPVGYVKEDGECVIYGWCKQHIRSNNYRASVDQAFRKQATRNPGGRGYSPYRDKKIKTTKERIVEENPLYTAEKPIITKQSGSLYLTLDSPDEAKLSVTVKKVPENEELSFQWYRNTVNSSEGAVAIDGANEAEYVMPKEVIDVYCYCAVTNKNTKNNKEAKTLSAPIKLRIAKSSEELKIDAETPIITKHPKSSKHAFIEGKNINISLSVEVNKPKDNGVLSYQWFESDNEVAGSGTKIENATEKIYKTELSDSGNKYYYCVVTNTNDKATGEKTVSVFSAIAKIEIEQLFELTFGCVGEGVLTVFGGEDGTRTVRDGSEDKIRVKIGTDLVFIAKPKNAWEIEKWEGKATVSEGNIKTAQMKIEKAEDVAESVVVSFKKIQKKGKLGIIAVRVENVSIDCKFWGKHYNGAYFWWDIITSMRDDSSEGVSQELWKQDAVEFLYTQGFGRSAYFMPEEKAKIMDISMNNTAGNLKLDFQITKRDSKIPIGGDHTWTMIDHGKGTVEFDYDATKDCWRVKDMNYDIDKVEVSYRKNFILKRGEEKDFTVTYKADNPDLSAVGSLKVVYTLLWE